MSMSPPNQRNFTTKRTKSPSSPLIQDSNGGGTFFKMDVGNQTKSSPSHISSSASTNTTGNVTTSSMLKSISTINTSIILNYLIDFNLFPF